MKTYSGDRTIDGLRVLVDDAPLSPRTDIASYSENGFEWTYEGDESRQLAFAIVFDHLGDAERARSLSLPFMREVVANFENAWEMNSDDVAAAVAALESSA